MKLSPFTLSNLLLLSAFCLLPYQSIAQKLNPIEVSPDALITWYNTLDIGLTGQAWKDLEHPYDRLPAKAKAKVRGPVWTLGTNTAGLSVHFKTNSKKIWAKWTVRYDNSMWHMTDAGIKGLDLYMNDQGTWRYAGTGSPAGKTTQRVIVSGNDGEMHEYHLNLPLYDGIDTLWLGVETGSWIEAYCGHEGKPLLIYGTSIQQGGCASRPGMAASNIISRQLNREVINLGFSGNGRVEMELAALIAEVDAAAYIIDCLPNVHNLSVIYPRYVEFVRFLREQRPQTPIILVETATTVKSAIISDDRKQMLNQNLELRKAYQDLLSSGIRDLYLVPGENLIGTDGEGTVDGVHYTDLGFMRYAEEILRLKAYGL